MKVEQTARVIKASKENPHIREEYVCSDLEQASKWAAVHRSRLKKDERYDIYYRYEIIK